MSDPKPVYASAFPVPYQVRREGMSLRAYFAAHAPEVPGDFVRMDVPCSRDMGGGRMASGTRFETHLEWIVRWRLAYADAMLKALK
jgi:hypothetical protein